MSKRPAPKLPAFLFYPGDWKKDPQLRKCSLAARGAWIELLCAMHENGRTGIVSGTVEELAQICGCNTRAMRRALDELNRLKTAHVTFGNKNVQVVNRRMQREHKSRESTKLRVRRLREKQRGNADVNFSSSSSSSSSSKEEELVSRKLGSVCEGLEGSKSTHTQDFSDAFFDDLQDREIYADRDVRRSFAAYQVSCEIEGIQPTPKKFLGWLNREFPRRKENARDDDRTNAKIDKVVQDLVRDRDLNKAQGGSS